MKPMACRGAALVMAMLVVALAAALSASVLWQLDLRVGQIEGGQNHAQARAIARIGVDYARAVLADDARHSSVDHDGEAWAARLPPIEVEGGEISGHIEDVQGKWNLNNLVSAGRVVPTAFESYRRLLGFLGLPATLAETLADWMDADDTPTGPEDAETNYYMGLSPPYPAANAPLTELGSLVTVKGYNSDVIARLRPYVTVLPGPQPINVNAASAKVLAAVIPGMDLTGAHRTVARRSAMRFRDIADFRNRIAPDLAPEQLAGLAVGSNYFLADVVARQGRAEAHLRALLHRHSLATPAIVWLISK